MKYKKFTIKNYKAIENVEINLTKNVIPLIGINESGKIIASVLIDDINEFEDIGRAINLDMNSPLYAWLKDKVMKNEAIEILREYDKEHDRFGKNYILYNTPTNIMDDKKMPALIKEIIKRLPNILYFDDFNDRVPQEIVFNENLQFSRGKDREWQEIEVFVRAIEDFSLEEFVAQNDEDDRNNYLSDVTSVLNEEIVKEWKNLKAGYSNFSDDSSELELRIIYNKEDGKTFTKITPHEYAD